MLDLVLYFTQGEAGPIRLFFEMESMRNQTSIGLRLFAYHASHAERIIISITASDVEVDTVFAESQEFTTHHTSQKKISSISRISPTPPRSCESMHSTYIPTSFT